MKKIEITLDEETGMYCIDQKINDNYQQGIRTYDIDEGLRYLVNRMEELTYDDGQTITTTN
ncbi:hypothetical protein phi9184_ORF069 [Enterococcus phage 9184]|uniref:Uncharacterized protein n=1 Tax=Enterococcus phage 9184 TaxID=2763103 RepID=A0A7L8ZIK7_9CAUD|nr:hypothetical protein phi9184_ORF069 [Enterococcus phage 9184]